LKAT